MSIVRRLILRDLPDQSSDGWVSVTKANENDGASAAAAGGEASSAAVPATKSRRVIKADKVTSF